MILELVPSDGSDDSKFAMCAAEASSPSVSSWPSTDVSSTSNPVSVPENDAQGSPSRDVFPEMINTATLQNSSYEA